METKTFTYNSLEYSELTEEAKEKALEVMAEVNVGWEWYEFLLTETAEDWENKYGITFEWGKVSFDLGRDRYLFFNRNGISVVNPYKLALAATNNRGYALLASKEALVFSFETYYRGGGAGGTHLIVEDNRSTNTKDLPVDFKEWFHDLCRDLLHKLSEEYSYLTSRESIKETIEANDYRFLEDGSRSGKYYA